MNEVRARFLKSILEQLPAERIVELHFFAPIRQGQIETGVAVIAADPERPLPMAEPEVAEEIVSLDGFEIVDDAVAVTDPDSPYADLPTPEAAAVADGELAAILDEHHPVGDIAGDDSLDPIAESAPRRYEILTAAYRWTRKGPERGKWEVDVTAEADAPFPTVGTVVKGVHDRAGEELEPLRLTAADLQALLSEPQWLTPA